MKWLWEPDDGSTRWVPYDAPLCQKIERHFQLWIMASSTTCAICASRRAAFPGGIATIQSSLLHQFRPDLVMKFAFSARVIAGKGQHFQVQSAARRTSARWRAHALTPGTQENPQNLEKWGISRDDDCGLVMPDSHGHPPGASAAVWAPDAQQKPN